MTPGNLELVQVLVSWSVTVPAVAAVIVRDERRLRGEALARAWPPSSRHAALLCLWLMTSALTVLVIFIAHFVGTRRSLRGLGLAVFWSLAVVAADFACTEYATPAVLDWLGV